MPSHEYEDFEAWVNSARKILERGSGEDACDDGIVFVGWSDQEKFYTWLGGFGGQSAISGTFSALVCAFMRNAVEVGLDPVAAVIEAVGRGMQQFHQEKVEEN